MPAPLVPIAMGVARAVGPRLLQAGAKAVSRQGIQNQAIKTGVQSATGTGVLSATPALAPTRTNGPDSVSISRESTTPAPSQPEQAEPQLPDLSSWAPHA